MTRYLSNFFAAFAPARAFRKDLLSMLVDLDAQYRSRRALHRLPAHLRQDVGLSDTDITAETVRTPWDAPAWWR